MTRSGKYSRDRRPQGQVALYNRLVWLFRILDRLSWRRLGLSVVAVGRTSEGERVAAAA